LAACTTVLRSPLTREEEPVTINFTNPTPAGKVRLLIADVDEDNLILTDDQINGYLAIESGSVKRAAASALVAIASSETLVSKKIRTLDGLQTDGPAVAAALLKHAQDLREQAETDEDDLGGIDIIDFQDPPLSATEATELRGSGF
jgi:hypothetical protein